MNVFGANPEDLLARNFDAFATEMTNIADQIEDGIADNPLPKNPAKGGPDEAVDYLPDPDVVAKFCMALRAAALKPQTMINEVGARFQQIEDINADLGSAVSDTSIRHH